MCVSLCLQADEYQFYYGYTGNTAAPTTAVATSAQADVTTTTTMPATVSAELLQQLSQEIRLAGDWADLLQLATEHQEKLTAQLWLRLLFRCVHTAQLLTRLCKTRVFDSPWGTGWVWNSKFKTLRVCCRCASMTWALVPSRRQAATQECCSHHPYMCCAVVCVCILLCCSCQVVCPAGGG